MSVSKTSEKKELLDLTIFMTSLALVGRVLSMPSGIIVAKVLGPVGLGSFAIINLIIKYLGYFDLGALKCIPRNATLAYGEDDYDRGDQIKDVVFTILVFATIIPLICLWILYIFGIKFNHNLNIIILSFISIIFLSNKLNAYIKSSLKADGNFKLIANVDVIDKILTPVFSIIFVIYLGLNGLLCCLIIINIIKAIYLQSTYKNLRANFYFNFKKSVEQIRTGIMLYSNGIGESFLLSIGLIMIANYLSQNEVGIFAFAIGIIMSKKIPFAAPINMVIRRKVLFDKGKLNNINSSKRLLDNPLFLYIMFHSIILGSIFLLYSYLTKYILTDYISSLTPMLIIYFGYIVYVSQTFHKNIIDASNQLIKILFSFIIGILITTIICYFSIINNMGINGISIACTSGFLMVAILNHYFAYKIINSNFAKGVFISCRIITISLLLTFYLNFLSNWQIIEFFSTNNTIEIIIYNSIELVSKIILFVLGNLFLFSLMFPKKKIIIELISIIAIYIKPMNKISN